METIVLDGALMLTREQAHCYLAAQLRLPDWYGGNLDALYDLLTERGEPLRLLVRRPGAVKAALGSYGAALLAVLREAAAENPALQLAFEEE